MEHSLNGVITNGGAGAPHENGFHEPTLEQLDLELPLVGEGQIPLGELVSRMAQSIYAEINELAETYVIPSTGDR